MADSHKGKGIDLEETVTAQETTAADGGAAKPPDAKEKVVTDSGLEISRLYTPADCPQGEAAAEQIGFPGQIPFTRGSTPNMYADQPWIPVMRTTVWG